ncbi:MAG TPA: hypothetical protein VFG86_16265 [Chloroflexota bacterium]|nr:hypothetical protein [Chloroflexota bacterium]
MRARIVDFLPLILAVLLVAGWFGLRQPLPFSLPPALSAPSVATSSPIQPAPQPGSPTAAALSRAGVIQSLCDPTQPAFLGSIATLKDRIGDRMGDARVCERQIDSDGNTEQVTTTGLAYYRRRLSAPIFTTGWEHWALVNGKLLYWTGDSVEPPADAVQAD